MQLSACAAVLLAALALPNGARAQQPAETYEALVREGLALSNAANWSEAYASFKRAYELKPGPRPLRGMAIVLFELRRYVEAIDCAERALTMPDDQKPLTDAMRAELAALRDKANLYVVRVQLQVQPEDARVYIDGTPRVEREIVLDEGDYTVEVNREGYAPRTISLRARVGQAPELSIALEPLRAATAPATSEAVEGAPAQAEEPSHVLSWTLIGVGGAAVVGGIVTGAMASSTFSDLDERCPGPRCTEDLRSDADSGRTLETVTNVLFVSGGVLIAAGLASRFLLETSETPRTTGAARLAPACSTDGCAVWIWGAL